MEFRVNSNNISFVFQCICIYYNVIAFLIYKEWIIYNKKMILANCLEMSMFEVQLLISNDIFSYCSTTLGAIILSL